MPSDAGVFVFHLKVAPEKEAAFNDWYDRIHIPDLLKLKSIHGAQRFKLTGPGQEMRGKTGEMFTPNYLTLYFLASADEAEIRRQLGEARPGWVEAGRLFDGYESGQPVVYAAVTERAKA